MSTPITPTAPPEAASPSAQPRALLAPPEAPQPTPDADRAAATGEGDFGGADGSEATSAATPSPAASPVLVPTPTSKEAPRQRVIALDPGHGGPEVGAAASGLAEKDLNLSIALKLADLLRAGGYRVVLTRDTDRAASPEYKGDGYRGAIVKDLQARVDAANSAGADLFLSIHNNGHPDPGESGTEVWYDPGRSFGDQNLALAELVLAGIVRQVRSLDYPDVERGVKDDTSFRIYQGRPYNIYVLGAGSGPRAHTPTQMPGVLGESLFLSNPGDAAMLRKPATLDAIAAGYCDAVVAYFEQYPD